MMSDSSQYLRVQLAYERVNAYEAIVGRLFPCFYFPFHGTIGCISQRLRYQWASLAHANAPLAPSSVRRDQSLYINGSNVPLEPLGQENYEPFRDPERMTRDLSVETVLYEAKPAVWRPFLSLSLGQAIIEEYVGYCKRDGTFIPAVRAYIADNWHPMSSIHQMSPIAMFQAFLSELVQSHCRGGDTCILVVPYTLVRMIQSMEFRLVHVVFVPVGEDFPWVVLHSETRARTESERTLPYMSMSGDTFPHESDIISKEIMCILGRTVCQIIQHEATDGPVVIDGPFFGATRPYQGDSNELENVVSPFTSEWKAAHPGCAEEEVLLQADCGLHGVTRTNTIIFPAP